jgi:hypothetical protein
MSERMPNYDVRNDGIGPYAVFYCEKCNREYRSKPNVANTLAKDIGRDAIGGALRGIPLFGRAIADNVTGEDPRYVSHMTPQQAEEAWGQVKENFRSCPTCLLWCCLSDYDVKAGFCNDDSPRKGEIAEAQATQAAGVVKGFAAAFGLTEVVKSAGEAAKRASESAARCPNDGTLAAAGTKFCPECGAAMIQPAAAKCAKRRQHHGRQVLPGVRRAGGGGAHQVRQVRRRAEGRQVLPRMWNQGGVGSRNGLGSRPSQPVCPRVLASIGAPSRDGKGLLACAARCRRGDPGGRPVTIGQPRKARNGRETLCGRVGTYPFGAQAPRWTACCYQREGEWTGRSQTAQHEREVDARPREGPVPVSQTKAIASAGGASDGGLTHRQIRGIGGGSHTATAAGGQWREPIHSVAHGRHRRGAAGDWEEGDQHR